MPGVAQVRRSPEPVAPRAGALSNDVACMRESPDAPEHSDSGWLCSRARTEMHALRIATCRPLPEPDADEEPLLQALARRGVHARMAAWRDGNEDWDARVPTVVRSTWDYLHHLDEFLAWVERAAAAAPFWNPPAIVRANVHKFYLRELEAAGHAIVPTAFLERGTPTSLAEVLRARGWQDVVVKPAVSAASFGTLRARAGVADELA